MKSIALSVLLYAGLAAPALANDPDADRISRGEYLVTIMDCAGCHMPRGADGAPIVEAGLAGGTVGFEIPGMGIFWPPNLTPDPSGLGGWTEAEIAAAISGGIARDGRMLAPAMPSLAYSALSRDDLDAVVAYLTANPTRQITFVGHTDATGSLEANVALSRRRAEAARAYVIARGVPASQVAADGVGFLSPRTTNLTEAGREANRRVEAVLISVQ